MAALVLCLSMAIIAANAAIGIGPADGVLVGLDLRLLYPGIDIACATIITGLRYLPMV